MGKRINLDKTDMIEIVGNGLIIAVSQDERKRILVRVESEIGGRRIIIKQHEEDARCLTYSIDKPANGSHLTLVD